MDLRKVCFQLGITCIKLHISLIYIAVQNNVTQTVAYICNALMRDNGVRTMR